MAGVQEYFEDMVSPLTECLISQQAIGSCFPKESFRICSFAVFRYTSHTMHPVDLQAHFPSLFVALDYLKEDPYEAGWLLGNISDVALVFITRLVLGISNDDDAVHRAYICSQYLQASSTSQENPGQPPVEVEELISVVRLMCATHSLTDTLRRPSFVPVNVSLGQQELVGMLDNTFDALLYAAVLEYLFRGSEQSAKVQVVNWGWDDGMSVSISLEHCSLTSIVAREIVNGPTDIALNFHDAPVQSVSRTAQETGVIRSESFLNITSMPAQYEPDDTKLEYVPTGPRVSLDTFCTSYEDLLIPGDPCGVCSENFLESEYDVMVRARCNARHLFHKDCLDAWVNESAMDNANKCPLDREVICGARGRIHTGEQIGDDGEAQMS
jgi:hypothetical protein